MQAMLYRRCLTTLLILVAAFVSMGFDDVANALRDKAHKLEREKRYKEAEVAFKEYIRRLRTRDERGADKSDYPEGLHWLGLFYHQQGRYLEAEAAYQEALRLLERPMDDDIRSMYETFALNQLSSLLVKQGRFADAVPAYRKLLARLEKSRGTKAIFGGAYEYWFVKLLGRLLVSDPALEPALIHESFRFGQLAMQSEAAMSLAQMAARNMNDHKLASLMRRLQDLKNEARDREKRDDEVKKLKAQEIDGKTQAENLKRWIMVETEARDLTKQLESEQANGKTESSIAPLTIPETQAYLAPDEALILVLPTASFEQIPGETFVWVVTKTDARWVRSEIGHATMHAIVQTLRCGLNGTTWDDADIADNCTAALGRSPRRDSAGNVISESLPFDLARARSLYTSLFGPIADLVRGKHLLVAASSPLAQLPFQVLVTDLRDGELYGPKEKSVSSIGVILGELSTHTRQELGLSAELGVKIDDVLAERAGAAAGLHKGDVLLAINENNIESIAGAVATIRAYAVGTPLRVTLLRHGRKLELSVVAESAIVTEWVPRFLDTTSSTEVAWLARRHAITVLPAVFSLNALRAAAKPSAAAKSMIGFGNPLLEGDPQNAWDVAAAAQARAKTRCEALSEPPIVVAMRKVRAERPVPMRDGIADLAHLRSASPLPDTAEELCAAAASLQAARTDVYLGENATEATIKKLSVSGELANYRVVHFATHGALAGEVSQTNEPGLILTPPAVQSLDDDGYLSASEIAQLRLDADWVVLSACNTAAGKVNDRDSEAMSGLANAFIYAGARALLVSHWPVDSAATVKLVTNAVNVISMNDKIDRAEALRRSMLGLIDSGDVRERHPSLWAPFVVVGEGAAR
jgi:CHAT domain-containing protein/tetratricopeptide (TPR) repeat protein